MYVAYSALREPDHIKQNKTSYKQYSFAITDPQVQGYLAACAKYSSEIAAIQKYMPGWMPEFKNL